MRIKAECSENGCNEPVNSLGLCKSHYNKAYSARVVDPEHPDRIICIKICKSKMAQEDYDGILADQSDGCAICGSVIPGGRGRFHVDHDHNCCGPGQKSCGKCVRGLLCVHCNFMLGHAQDDPGVLRAAADYLERHQMTLEESP